MANFSDFDVWEPIFLGKRFSDDGILQLQYLLLRPSKSSTGMATKKHRHDEPKTTEKCHGPKYTPQVLTGAERPYEYLDEYLVSSCFVPEFVGLW